MAKDLNLCQFIGRLGNDPEVRYLSSGTAVASMSVAVGGDYKNKEGEKVEVTEWVKAEAWGRLAELCEQYLGKGDRIYFSGPLKTQSWEDNDGVKRYMTLITVKELQFLNTKGADENGGKSGGNGKGSGKSGGKSGGKPPVDDSDIPF